MSAADKNKRTELFQQAIEENRSRFLSSLENTPKVIKQLWKRNVLSDEELKRLKETSSLFTEKQKLINQIRQKHFEDIDDLIDVLNETNNTSLGSLLSFHKTQILKKHPRLPDEVRQLAEDAASFDEVDTPHFSSKSKKYTFNSPKQDQRTSLKNRFKYWDILKGIGSLLIYIFCEHRKVQKPSHAIDQPCSQCSYIILFQAALSGNFDQFIKSLESLDSTPCDDCLKKTRGQTLLHAVVSAKRSASKVLLCVRALLNILHGNDQNAISGEVKLEKYLNQRDNLGQTALHLAALKKRERVVQKLYQEYEFDILIKDIYGQTVLDLISKHLPKITWKIFNTETLPTVKNSETFNRHFTLNIDFGLIIGYPLVEESRDKKTTAKKYTEMRTLMKLVQGNRKSSDYLLAHVMVETFLRLKWKKMRVYLYFYIILQIVVHLWYTLFIIQVFLADCPINGANLCSEIDCNAVEWERKTVVSYLFSGWKFVLRALTGYYDDTAKYYSEIEAADGRMCNFHLDWQPIMFLVFGCLYFIKELCEAIFLNRVKDKKRRLFGAYLSSWENWIQLFSNALMILIGTVGFQTTVPNFYYTYAALSIVLVWALIFIEMGYLLGQSIYVLIIGKITKRFVALMLNYLCWIIAFAISLSILFPRESSFETLPKSFFRVISMMTGELNYADAFYGYFEGGNSTEVIGGPSASIVFSAHIIYISLALLLTIVLTNALIGLAVSDVQELRERSEVLLRSIQVSKLYTMESALLQLKKWRIFPFLIKNIFVIKPSSIWDKNGEPKLNKMVLQTSLNSLGVSKHLREKIREFAMDRKAYKNKKSKENDPAPMSLEDLKKLLTNSNTNKSNDQSDDHQSDGDNGINEFGRSHDRDYGSQFSINTDNSFRQHSFEQGEGRNSIDHFVPRNRIPATVEENTSNNFIRIDP